MRAHGVASVSAMALVAIAAVAAVVAGPARAVPASRSALRVAARDAVTPWAKLPRRLSDTGLYAADGSIDPRNRPFAPQYPLWTDGADKSRWVRLPDGARIDVTDVDAWRFPVGTTFWKEFAWHGRKVETRMIRVERHGWTYATYVWNDAQTDAVLAAEDGELSTAVVGVQHAIPSQADCVACHGGSPAKVLGFTTLQLSDDRDPLAPHQAPVPAGGWTLRSLLAAGKLWPPRPEWATQPPRIHTSDPVARAALGYLSGNCGSCHNARGPLARLGFAMLHDEAHAPERALSLVSMHGRFVVPRVAADSSYLVAPGAPERSAVIYRMSSIGAASRMPPMGRATVDTAAVALVRRWIAGLAQPRIAADAR